MTGTSEAAVVAAGGRELKKRGAWTINIHGTATGRAGTPDVIGVYRGQGIAIEYKRPQGGQLSPRQRFELERFKLAGGHAIVARSRQDVADLLDLIDRQVDGPA